MNKIIVIQFVTLDGVVEDPDGRGGTPYGGWAFRFGPEVIGGDKFRLGSIMQSGALLFGRRTWQHFAGLWPQRTDPFSAAMNALPKHVVSRTTPDLGAWSNSHRLEGELVTGALGLATQQDVVVIGSTGVVQQLAAAGAVDEYRLLTFPTILGVGRRLCDQPLELDLVESQVTGPVTLATYRPAARR